MPAERAVRVRLRAGVEAAVVFVLVATIAASLTGLRSGLAFGAVAVGVAVITTVTHEAGHAVAAWVLGLRVSAFTATGLLSARTTRSRTTDARKEVAVCLAGPLVTLAELGFALVMTAASDELLRFGAQTLVVTTLTGLGGSLWPAPGTDLRRALTAVRSTRPELVTASGSPSGSVGAR